jgi:ABC-type Fe3+ transport system permease subunit
MLIVAGTLYFYFRLTREAARFHTITGKGYRPRLISLGRWRFFASAGLLQLHRELEEAAYASGASWSNCMRRIVLPLLTPCFFGGWVFVFLLSAKELSMSVLLVSPRTPVVSVAIYELGDNAQVRELAAFGVAWTAILASVAVVYYFVMAFRWIEATSCSHG